jgi:hypothetical protein
MRAVLPLLLIVFINGIAWAQDFGFGSDDSSPPVSVKAGGWITMEMPLYVHDFAKEEGSQEISFWDMVSGNFNLNLSSSHIEAYSSLNLNADSLSELWNANSNLRSLNYTPLFLDEAYVRAYIGPVNIVTGFRKLTWGKADSPGPLDVTNPTDYTDLRYITDLKASKIARPMVHVTWNTGNFSKLEGVFIPNFAGHRFAQEGRWTPSQLKDLTANAEEVIASREEEMLNNIYSDPSVAALLLAYPGSETYILQFFNNVQNEAIEYFNNYSFEYPNTSGINYFQAGLRYTATIGSVDIGGQYFYGNLFRPDVTISNIDDYIDDLIIGNTPINIFNPYTGDPSLITPVLKYNRYHQIGLDYAQVLAGFNLRAEAAIFLTEDLKGTDGSVQNPFIGWSLGFDRELFWGISLNIQCNETIRLMNDKVGDDPTLDAEADTDMTSTRLTMQLSKKFFRDNLESKVTVIWGVEDSDCYIIPAFIWSNGNMTSELSAGIFAGKESGELGQYWENSFIRLALTYSF